MEVNTRGALILPYTAAISGVHDIKSTIKFAPGTNFQEGFKNRRISEDAEFNIRMVDKTSNLSHSLNTIPSATDMDDSYVERTDDRTDRRTTCFPRIINDRGLVEHLCQVPAPVGVVIPTLCSYVAQDKPLLSAAKSSMSSNPRSCPQEKNRTMLPLRFPPLASRASSKSNQHKEASYLGPHCEQNLTAADKNSRLYASTESLSSYLRQSTFLSDCKGIDVYRPYRHVPNLVNARGQWKAFLRDNERIKMLQVACLTDDHSNKRLEAYKPPNADSVKHDFLII